MGIKEMLGWGPENEGVLDRFENIDISPEEIAAILTIIGMGLRMAGIQGLGTVLELLIKLNTAAKVVSAASAAAVTPAAPQGVVVAPATPSVPVPPVPTTK